MSLNVPVICSNVTSLPETINSKKFVFNPYDEEEMAILTNDMLSSSSLLDENIENSRIQIKRFDWKVSISNLIYGYKCAINNFNTFNTNRNRFESRLKYEREYEDTLNTLNSVNKIIDDIPSNKSIVIYAAGEHTKHLFNLTNIKNKNINCIIDKNRFNFKFMGYDVKKVEHIKTLNPDIIVISSFSYQDNIEKYLIEDLNYTGQIIKLYNNENSPFYL
jgi:hypothetical protein